MNASQKHVSQNRAESEKQPDKRQPEPELPATLGQKILVVALYCYLLSLVWLVLSHNWYGVLPKWLDPQ